jgi:hypothetical protein
MRKKIRREGERVCRETGIDFQKYRKPEMVEKIGDLIDIIGQVRGILLRRYMLLLLIITVLSAWFYTRGMNIVGVVLFFAVGVLFSACAGTALCIIKVTEKGVKDSAAVTVMMLGFVKDVRVDLDTAAGKSAGEVPAPAVMEGVSYCVFIPIVSGVVREQLSLFAWPVNFVVENALFYLTQSLASMVAKVADDDAGAEKAEEPENTEKDNEDREDRVNTAIDAAIKNVEPLADSVVGMVTIPAKILLILTMIIGLPLLWLIYFIF